MLTPVYNRPQTLRVSSTMVTFCTYSYDYDPIQGRAEHCENPAVGSCYFCEMFVCLFHAELCACGEIFCQSCRPVHQAECRIFKVEAFEKVERAA